MRKFIYLDTDTLNSYLAQIYDGLIKSEEIEKSAEKKIEKQNQIASTLGGQIALKLFGKGLDAKAESSYEHLKNVAEDEMIKDVQTKVLHDNAFNLFVNYITEKDLIKGNKIGDFISVEDNFYIFDIAFYQTLFKQDNGFITGLKELQKNNIQKEAELKVAELNREQQRDKNTKKQVKDIVDEQIKNNDEEFSSAETLVNMLADIIPYPQIMCISKYMVVLNEQFLRDDLSTAAFKYGGRIKVVGYITNKVMAEGNSKVSAFASFGNSINALMKIFFENADEMFIIHPIAIFYDD